MKQMKCGHEVSETFNPEKLELIGFIGDINELDRVSRDAETSDLQSGSSLFYYCEEETLKYIRSGEVVPTAREQGLCADCLRGSMNTAEPHYGDGVYFTQHPNLRNLEQTHPVVVQSHGIDMVKRRWRAEYVCMNASPLKKIRKTGGVVRSKEHRLTREGRLELETGVVAPFLPIDFEAYEEE